MTEKQKAVIERARNTPARFITVENPKRVTRFTAAHNHIAKYGEIQKIDNVNVPDGTFLTAPKIRAYFETLKEQGLWKGIEK